MCEIERVALYVAGKQIGPALMPRKVARTKARQSARVISRPAQTRGCRGAAQDAHAPLTVTREKEQAEASGVGSVSADGTLRVGTDAWEGLPI